MAGLYSTNTPERLFNRLVERFSAFCDLPNEDGIFDVIFPLYHLREWICPGGYESYKHKAESNLSREERIHRDLHTMPEYGLVRALCNNAKHFDAVALGNRTKVYEGLRAGFGKAGDSLGVTHFVIDGYEIRDVFWRVYRAYFDYFRGG